jgi:predicted double-glycine peptidase
MHIQSLIAGCITGLVFTIAAAHAEDAGQSPPRVMFGNVVPGLPLLSKPIRSMHDLRYRDMVRQESDFTCGAAALATILQHVFGRNISESDIVEDMLKNTDANAARQHGFSLLDMKRYVERIGLRAHGYRVDRNSLLALKIPVIALQITRGYAHFVVVKRVYEGIAYIADPALGHREMPLDEFVAASNGIVFAVVGKGLRQENALVASARSLSASQRADIVTRALPPQQEFGLLGMDTF